MSTPSPPPLLEVDRLTLRFRGLVAVSDVSLTVNRGEIQAYQSLSPQEQAAFAEEWKDPLQRKPFAGAWKDGEKEAHKDAWAGLQAHLKKAGIATGTDAPTLRLLLALKELGVPARRLEGPWRRVP